jgi:hypothetical protein
LDPLNSFGFFGNAGSFQLAGLNEADRNPSLQSSDLKHRREIQTQNTDLKHGPETGPANAQGTCGARLSSRRNRKRGSQGVDALYYTERTGTPSNKPCRSGWLDAAKPQLVYAASSRLSAFSSQGNRFLTRRAWNLLSAQTRHIAPCRRSHLFLLFPNKIYDSENEVTAMSDPVTGDVFKPGEDCKRSGVYRVLHDPNHADEHEVTCVFGTKFPLCNQCGDYVRFILEHSAIRIDSHDHFKS